MRGEVVSLEGDVGCAEGLVVRGEMEGIQKCCGAV